MDKTSNGLMDAEETTQILPLKKSRFKFESVKKGGETPYIEEGWEIDKTFKTTTRLKKNKPLDVYFEDQVWTIIAQMGFKKLNSDNRFKIPISDANNVNPKQIDIFAMDDEVALVIECKSAVNLTNGSFRTTILEISGYRENLIKAIHKLYNPNLKIGFVIATKNLIWGQSDFELAKNHNITLMTDDEFEYYSSLVDHLGPAAKYQLLAEIFAEKQIPGLEHKVPAIRGTIGNHAFYAFAIEPSKLLQIAFVSHRSKADKDTIISYQRMLKKKRLQAIRDYIETDGGLFPNSVIINFYTDKKPLNFDRIGGNECTEAVAGYLHLPNRYKSAWIIDGQHRLYGFSGTPQADKVTIPVVAFENLDAATQARMFVDINSKQERVKKNHLQDLYSDLLWDSKKESEKLMALTSKLVSEIGMNMRSPLYKKIKSSAESTSSDRPITITTLTTAITDSKLLGRVAKGSNLPSWGPLYSLKEPRMENSLKRSREILISYLNIFKNGVPENWDKGDQPGGYLCTNNGISSLIIVLKEIIIDIERKKRYGAIDIEIDELNNCIAEYAMPIVDYFNNATFEEISSYRKQYGKAGQANSAYSMLSKIHEKNPDFNPEGLSKYIADQNSTWNEEARRIVPEIQLAISEFVLTSLKKQFPVPDDSWWFDGVPNSVRDEIVLRREKDPEHRPNEQYFDLIHYEAIANKHWQSLFGKVFGFKELGTSKEKQLSWFDRLNRIRNTISHPERGRITKDDYDFLLAIKERIKDNIQKARLNSSSDQNSEQE